MFEKLAASGSSAGGDPPCALGAWKILQRSVKAGPKAASAASTRPSEVAEQVLANILMLVEEGTDSRKSWTPALGMAYRLFYVEANETFGR